MRTVLDQYLATEENLRRNRMNTAQLAQMQLQDEYNRKTMADRVRAAAIANQFNQANAIGLENKNRLFGDTYDDQVASVGAENRLRQAQALGLETDAQYAPQRALSDMLHKQAQAQHQQFQRDDAIFKKNILQQKYIGEAARRAMEQYPDDPQAQADAVLGMAQRTGGFNEQIIESITPDNIKNLALTPASGEASGSRYQFGATGQTMQDPITKQYFRMTEVRDPSTGEISLKRSNLDGIPVNTLGLTASGVVQQKQSEAEAGAKGTGQTKDFLATANTGVQSADALLNVKRAMIVGKEISQGGLASATERFKGFFGANDANAAEFLARTTESALLALKPLVGSPATDTDAELVKETVANIRTNGAEANMQLLEKIEKSLNEKIQSGMDAATSGSLDPFYAQQMQNKVNRANTDPYYVGQQQQQRPGMDQSNQGLVPTTPAPQQRTRGNTAQEGDTVRDRQGNLYKVINGELVRQ